MQDELFRSFLTSVRLENKSPETMRTYEKCLRKYREFLLKKKKDVDKNSVMSFIESMSKQGMEPSSIRLYMIILKRFFEYIDADFPKIKYPKTPRKKPIFIEQDDLLRMYALIKDPEMKALFSVDYITAMRINELVTRKMKDLEIKQVRLKDDNGNFTVRTIGSIYVSGKTGPESDAKLPLDETAITDLKAYLANQRLEPDDYIFHRNGDPKTPMSKSTLTVRLYALCKQAGMEPMSWHKIRHSRATHMREQGVALENIQAQLRHSSISTTLIYASTDTEKLRKATDGTNVLSKRNS